MNRKVFVSTTLTVCAALAALVLFFTLRSAWERTDGRAFEKTANDPRSIDIDLIESDTEFAETVPAYRISAGGLVEEDLVITFTDIIKKYDTQITTFDATGVRSDGETISLTFTGIAVETLFSDLVVQSGVGYVAIYGSDLYAAVIPYEEFFSGNLFLVWKKEGRYMNAAADGILKIVQDGGPTNAWVKNPVRFDFMAGFDDRVPLSDRIDIDTIEFITQQSLFTLGIGRTPDVDIDEYTLRIKGLVAEPVTLTYDMLVSLHQNSVYATLETISNPPGGRSIGNAIWTGVPFSSLLSLVSPDETAREVVFYCLDGYSTSLTVEEVEQDGVLLAYRLNGETLLPRHGYPVRLVVPEKYGMKWPKWIYEIEVVDFDYKGYWETRGWSDYAGRDRPDLRYD